VIKTAESSVAVVLGARMGMGLSLLRVARDGPDLASG
jgi:hypothetical protein